MKKNSDLGLLLTRIIISAPMLCYGISKLINGIDFIKSMMVEAGLPSFFAYGVYIGEVVAPLLMIVGIRTRISSLIFAINCLTIILLSQTQNILSLNEYGGWALELIAIYFVISISLFFTGGGRFAVSTANKWD